MTSAVDFDPTVPRAELGESGVVEERADTVTPRVVRFLDGGRAGRERQVGAKAAIEGVDRNSNHLHGLDDPDGDRAEMRRVATVCRGALRCEHAELLVAIHHAE